MALPVPAPTAPPGAPAAERQRAVAEVLRDKGHSSAAVSRRLGSKWPRPVWHAPWRRYRVISGHLGWVRSVAFDPGNEWFATGSSDRTIKLWDLASGQLKLTLTGHIEQVRRRRVRMRRRRVCVRVCVGVCRGGLRGSCLCCCGCNRGARGTREPRRSRQG